MADAAEELTRAANPKGDSLLTPAIAIAKEAPEEETGKGIGTHPVQEEVSEELDSPGFLQPDSLLTPVTAIVTALGPGLERLLDLISRGWAGLWKHKTEDVHLPDIPEDVIMANILVRLPLNDVGKWRCVSNSWRKSISTASFNKQYSEFHGEAKGEVCLVQFAGKNKYCIVGIRPEIKVTALNIFHGPSVAGEGSYITGSCRGLLLYRHDGFLSLLNPITSAVLRIPLLFRSFCFGLGHSNKDDDMKIVAYGTLEDPTVIMIYGVKNQTWREADSIGRCECQGKGGIFVEGHVHWMCSDPQGGVYVAAFNISDETFHEIRVPPVVNHMHTFVIAISSCLALGHWRTYCIMKKYRDNDSWVIFHLKMRIYDVVPLSMIRDELIYTTERDRKVFAVNWFSRDDERLIGDSPLESPSSTMHNYELSWMSPHPIVVDH